MFSPWQQSAVMDSMSILAFVFSQAVTASLLNIGIDTTDFVPDSSLFMTTSNLNPEDFQESPPATSRSQNSILLPSQGIIRYNTVHNADFSGSAIHQPDEVRRAARRDPPYHRIREAPGNQVYSLW